MVGVQVGVKGGLRVGVRGVGKWVRAGLFVAVAVGGTGVEGVGDGISPP